MSKDPEDLFTLNIVHTVNTVTLYHILQRRPIWTFPVCSGLSVPILRVNTVYLISNRILQKFSTHGEIILDPHALLTVFQWKWISMKMWDTLILQQLLCRFTHYTETWICHIYLNPSLAEHDMPLANSVDPDHLASEEANWSGSALFVSNVNPTDLDLHCLSLNVNFYQKSGSSNLTGWKLEVGVAS